MPSHHAIVYLQVYMQYLMNCIAVCSCRWGDYSGIAMDPDGETFWVFNAYGQQNNAWGTWLAAFKCSGPDQGRRRQLLTTPTPSAAVLPMDNFRGATLAPGGTGYADGVPPLDLGNNDDCL